MKIGIHCRLRMVVMHSVMDVLSVNVLRLLETCPKALLCAYILSFLNTI